MSIARKYIPCNVESWTEIIANEILLKTKHTLPRTGKLTAFLRKLFVRTHPRAEVCGGGLETEIAVIRLDGAAEFIYHFLFLSCVASYRHKIKKFF